MNITEIPFNKFIDIKQHHEDQSCLVLEFKEQTKNHLGTMHASAQFALAEACSGLVLQKCFPHLEGSVVPMLRKSDVKFKRPATSSVFARAEISEDQRKRFEQQLERKGRASIEVTVDVIEQDGATTMAGIYEWFAQKL